MTAAIRVCDSEGKGPDHVAGRFEPDAPETLAHSTIGRRSPHRCRPSPRSLVECGLLGVIHVLSSIAGSALADISGAVVRSARFIPCAWFLGVALSQLLSRVDLQLLKVALHRLSQIRNQMVTIRDLNGGGSPLLSSIGIQAGPIAGDHFHLRMQTEPACNTIGGSLGKQVDHL
jgi:hypothetical protein